MLRPHYATLLVATLLAACGGGGGGGGGGGEVAEEPGLCIPAGSTTPVPIRTAQKEVTTNTGDFGMYLDGNSYLPGDTITFHGATTGDLGPITSLTFGIYRLGGEVNGSGDLIPVEWQDAVPTFPAGTVPDNGWESCCNWGVVRTFRIPDSWPTGVYWAKFSSETGQTSEAFFVVRPKVPAQGARKIVVSVPFTTAYAYDNWGGKRVYPDMSTDESGQMSDHGVKASRVSLSRPFAGASRDKFTAWLGPFIEWAGHENLPLEFIANTDMHKDPEILDPYDLFVTIGHDEYWSAEMRAAVERHLDAGGNAAFLSGNNMWWKVLFEGPTPGLPNGRMLVDKNDEPGGPGTVRPEAQHQGHWYMVNPEAKLFGAAYAKGGYNRGGGGRDPDEAFARINYAVGPHDHWAFEGTNLNQGDLFGGNNEIISFEADGADFRWSGADPVCSAGVGDAVHCLPVALHGDHAPANVEILATAQLGGWQSDFENEAGFYLAGYSAGLTDYEGGLYGAGGGWATMVAYKHAGGGDVFNAATVDWARGLAGCAGASPDPECRITHNVFNRLQTADKDLSRLDDDDTGSGSGDTGSGSGDTGSGSGDTGSGSGDTGSGSGDTGSGSGDTGSGSGDTGSGSTGSGSTGSGSTGSGSTGSGSTGSGSTGSGSTGSGSTGSGSTGSGSTGSGSTGSGSTGSGSTPAPNPNPGGLPAC